MQKSILFLGSMAFVCSPAFMQAATLTAVPMQGSMAMPMVAYSAASGSMGVMMPGEVPQLTPLLMSNPGDGFDPSAPWFSLLDPSAQGWAFSRRYGFDMDPMSDPLPANTQMWIRKLSGPAELSIFNYLSSPPTFVPVFGTDGATNAIYWSGLMWHPVVAAPQGTNSYTATFEVFLLDTTTGQEVANSSSGPLTFNWTDISDNRPGLNITQGAAGIVITWPLVTGTNWALESVSKLISASWTTVTNTPVPMNGLQGVVLDASAPQQFFRMRYQP